MNKIIYLLAIILPFGLVLLVVYKLIYRSFWFKKNVLKIDSEMKYFLFSEFDSKATDEEIKAGFKVYEKNGYYYLDGSGKANMNSGFLATLEAARNDVEIYNEKNSDNLKFLITSGYRTPKHNEAVGGVNDSAHTKGLAADLFVGYYSETQKQIILSFLRKYFTRIGVSEQFFHVDTDGTKPQLEWTY